MTESWDNFETPEEGSRKDRQAGKKGPVEKGHKGKKAGRMKKSPRRKNRLKKSPRRKNRHQR
jgi:hypothetical protein